MALSLFQTTDVLYLQGLAHLSTESESGSECGALAEPVGELPPDDVLQDIWAGGSSISNLYTSALFPRLRGCRVPVLVSVPLVLVFVLPVFVPVFVFDLLDVVATDPNADVVLVFALPVFVPVLVFVPPASVPVPSTSVPVLPVRVLVPPVAQVGASSGVQLASASSAGS